MNFFSVSAQPGLGQHNTWTQTCKFYVCCPACKKYKQVYEKCKINWPWNFWVWKLKSVPKTNPGGLCCILPDRYGLNQGLGMIRNKVERYIVSFSFTGRIIWGKSDHTIWPKYHQNSHLGQYCTHKTHSIIHCDIPKCSYDPSRGLGTSLHSN